MKRQLEVGGIILAVAVGLVWALQAAAKPATQPTSAPATDYAIKLTRPVQVGRKSQSAVSGTSKTTQVSTTHGKSQTKREELIYERAGIDEVLEIDAAGQPSAVTFTVDKCVVLQAGKRTNAAAKGVEAFIVNAWGVTEAHPKDSDTPLSQDAVRVLRQPGLVHTADATDDEAFGTDKRRKIGDSWPVNSDVLARVFGKQLSDAKIKKESVSGTVKLAGLTKVAGIECLDVRVEIRIKDDCVPTRAGIAGEKGEVVVSSSMTAALPVDSNLPVLSFKSATSSKITVWNKVINAKGPALETTMEETMSGTGAPVKK